LDLAEKLGLAFQLTNIIRDVHEDYKIARGYLPEEDLQRYGVSPEDFAHGEATLGVRSSLQLTEARGVWRPLRLAKTRRHDSRAFGRRNLDRHRGQIC